MLPLMMLLSPPAIVQTLLRVATLGTLTGALPTCLGAKRGIFQKYRLTVEVIASRNEQMNMRALMSDTVRFLTLSCTGLFYLGKRGDAVGSASWSLASPWGLGSRFKIKELKSEARQIRRKIHAIAHRLNRGLARVPQRKR